MLVGALKVAAGFMAVAIVGAIVLLATTIAVYRSYANGLVTPQEMAVNHPSAGAKILDRNGKLLYQYIDDKEGLRDPVKLEDVSPAFLAATIATEDWNFFDNPGVNHNGLFRAVVENLNPFQKNKELLKGGGGSSITQQLVKNVYISQDDRSKRSLDRKIKEIVYAIELTKRYPKEQILEWYVNQISYGGIYSGVEAASQGYFGKPAKDLTLAEAALLAGIPQSPAAYDPISNPEEAIQRRNEVLTLLEKRGRILIGNGLYFVPNKDEIEAAKQAPIELQQQRFPIEAPHFVLTYVGPKLEAMFGKDAILHDGLTVTTTLDLDLQNQVNDILDKSINRYEAVSNTHNGAVVIIAPKTGEILTMIGSRDYYRDDIDGQVNNLLAKNSPGSSFKPFVYMTAFIKDGWSPGTIIQDTPIVYHEVSGASFQPQNPIKNSYKGNIPIREALAESLNVPAFKTAAIVGVDDVVSMAKKMGFSTFDSQYGPSIAIGGVDIAALDLAYGYTILANNGVMVGSNAVAPESADERELDPIAILHVEDRNGLVRYDAASQRSQRRIVPPQYPWLITSILTDPQAVCATFGCGGLNVPGYQVAVKTGTSEPFDPNGPYADRYGETWAFGYTPDFVVGVWAGNADNAPISNLYSTSIAFPAMRDSMLAAYNGRPETPFEQPPGVYRTSTCVNAPSLPGVIFAPAPAFPKLDVGGGRPGPCTNDWAAQPSTNAGVQPQVTQPGAQASPQPGTQAIDSRTGQPADASTPPEFIEIRPTETASPEPTATTVAPTNTPAATSPAGRAGRATASITSPGGGPVSGVVAIQGTASSPNMQYYRVEYSGAGSGWTSLGQWSSPVSGDTLATWSTLGLPKGQYTLRLTVQDARLGATVSTVTVTVS
jgi:membrane peptidoglycan carboxypeptidase